MAKTKKSPSPAPKRNSAGKPWLKVLLWTGIALGTLLLLTLLGMFVTFSGYRDYPEPNIGKPHYRFLRSVASQMRNNKRRDEATIRMSPAEVGLLLDIIRHTTQFVGEKHQVPQPQQFMIDYDSKGSFGFAVPVDAAGPWCFGGKIYVSGELFFEKKGNEIAADMPKLCFGRFDMPIPGGADFVAPNWRKRLERAFSKDFTAAIKSIHTERDGTVVLTYSPNELRKPLKKHLDQVYERCSESLKPWIRQLIQAL